MASTTRFSVIVCSHRPERAAFIRRHYETLFGDRPHEIIVIRDARSLCEGYTRGFRQSTGDCLVFSHDDVEFVTPDVAARLERHLEEFDVVGIAGTTKLIGAQWFAAGDPHCFALVIYPEADGRFSVRYAGAGPLCVPGIQALDGCFFACRREVVAAVGFDAETFDGFHLYDLDFTFGAYLRGYRLAVCRDLALIHASLGNPDDVWHKYRERFEEKYREKIAWGTPGHLNIVSGSCTKEQLPGACEPEQLLRSIRWS